MRSRVLNVMRHLTGSQCSSKSMVVTWSRFDRISITQAQANVYRISRPSAEEWIYGENNNKFLDRYTQLRLIRKLKHFHIQ